MSRFPGFIFRRELLLHLGGDGIGVHFVSCGSILEHDGWISASGCKQDARLHQQPGEGAFIGAAEKAVEHFGMFFGRDAGYAGFERVGAQDVGMGGDRRGVDRGFGEYEVLTALSSRVCLPRSSRSLC